MLSMQSETPAFLLPFRRSHIKLPQRNIYEERGGQRFQGDSQRGDLTLVPAGMASRWIWQEPASLLGVEVSRELIDDAAAELGRGGRPPEIRNRFRVRDPEIERICLALLAELRSGGLAGRLYVESLIRQMAVCLLRRHSDIPLAPNANPGLPRNRLLRVIDFIEANLTDGVPLQQLASLAGLSPFHFARQFKDATGLAPHQFVLRSRVERAKQLLERTELSLAEIGLTLGFSHQSHFTNVFRRCVGTTPKAWREEQ
jgi:AraC family transcriptional regulator